MLDFCVTERDNILLLEKVFGTRDVIVTGKCLCHRRRKCVWIGFSARL